MSFRELLPPEPSPPPQPRKTLTLLPNSSVLVLPPSELLALELVLDQFSALWSSDTHVTLPWNNNFSHMLSSDLLCLKPWVFSVWWWPFCFFSPSKMQLYTYWNQLWQTNPLFCECLIKLRTFIEDYSCVPKKKEKNRSTHLGWKSFRKIVWWPSNFFESFFCFVTFPPIPSVQWNTRKSNQKHFMPNGVNVYHIEIDQCQL